MNDKKRILKILKENREVIDKPAELEELDEGFVYPVDKLQQDYRRKRMAWLAFLYPLLISAGVYLAKKTIRLGAGLVSLPVLDVISVTKNPEGELLVGFNVKKIELAASKTPNNYDNKAVDILRAGADELYKRKGN